MMHMQLQIHYCHSFSINASGRVGRTFSKASSPRAKALFSEKQETGLRS